MSGNVHLYFYTVICFILVYLCVSISFLLKCYIICLLLVYYIGFFVHCVCGVVCVCVGGGACGRGCECLCFLCLSDDKGVCIMCV